MKNWRNPHYYIRLVDYYVRLQKLFVICGAKADRWIHCWARKKWLARDAAAFFLYFPPASLWGKKQRQRKTDLRFQHCLFHFSSPSSFFKCERVRVAMEFAGWQKNPKGYRVFRIALHFDHKLLRSRMPRTPCQCQIRPKNARLATLKCLSEWVECSQKSSSSVLFSFSREKRENPVRVAREMERKEREFFNTDRDWNHEMWPDWHFCTKKAPD